MDFLENVTFGLFSRAKIIILQKLCFGGYYFKILYFDSWYVILVQSLIGDRGISEMIDELWEHDDCLENQFSLSFPALEKRNVNPFFPNFLLKDFQNESSKVHNCSVYSLEDLIKKLDLFFVTSSWIYLAFYSLLSFKKTLHSISQFNQVLLSTLKHCTQVVKKGVFFIEWLDLWHEWRHYWQKCQL